MENKNKSSGVRRILKAAGFSVAGLKSAWVHEAAFRQEVMLMAVLLPLGLFLGQNTVERVLLLSPCFLVVIVELLNSAVEAVVDRIGSEHHELAGRAKDLGSAAVFVSLVFLVVVWAIILVGRFC